jgi:hypothetical protein
MDRPNVVTRISKLKFEIERLRILASDCHPAVSTETTTLADDMNSRGMNASSVRRARRFPRGRAVHPRS